MRLRAAEARREPSVSAASELLLHFLSAPRRATPVARPAIADLRCSVPQWTGIVDAAVAQGLAPLLFKRLKQSAARARIPADVWERLRPAYFSGAGRNVRLYRELGFVLRCLRGCGIAAIVLKGAFLAEAVYGDVAVRPMCDVDLLVPRADLPRARAVLLDMGGSQRQYDGIESCCRKRPHLPPVRVRRLAVELHWTIACPTGPVRVDTAGLWHRARATTIAGVEVLTLSPEDLLLHLCLHFCRQHRLAGLRSLCDVAETVHRFRRELDWTQVAGRAREWDAARYVGLTLHLVRSMLDAAVPDEVLERLAPGGIDRRVLETARESVLARTGYGQWLSPFDFAAGRSIGNRVKLPWERVFPSRTELAAVYPASRASRCLCFYYALRLGRAIRRRGPYALRRVLLSIWTRGRDRRISLVNWLRSG